MLRHNIPKTDRDMESATFTCVRVCVRVRLTEASAGGQ